MSDEPSAESPPPSSPEVSVAPGWYSVDAQTNTQAYWDGEQWAGTRRWRGSGWVEDSGESVPAGAGAFAAGASAGSGPPRGGTAAPPPPRYLSHSAYPPSMARSQPEMTRPPVAQTTNGSAIASLVLSILGLFGIGSLLGIIFGYRARREIRESGGYQSGDGLALAGIIIGIVTLVLFLVVLALWISLVATIHSDITQSSQQEQTAQCQANLRTVAIAVSAYHAEKGSFPVPPAPWSSLSYLNNYGPLTSAVDGGPYLSVAPPTVDFVVEYDSTGNVWVAPPNTFEPAFEPNQGLDAGTEACEIAVSG